LKYRFFHIPAVDPAAETEALNRFLGQRRILAVERHLIDDGQASFWALAVVYADTESAPGTPEAAAQGRKSKVDYREVLSERDFAAYAALRSLRKELAEREGVPAYALFTNEQLAAMVQRRARTAADLAEIAGVGKARVERYAEPVRRVRAEQGSEPDEEGADAPGPD
jgi:superfamily II DNA helicase RecQ